MITYRVKPFYGSFEFYSILPPRKILLLLTLSYLDLYLNRRLNTSSLADVKITNCHSSFFRFLFYRKKKIIFIRSSNTKTLTTVVPIWLIIINIDKIKIDILRHYYKVITKLFHLMITWFTFHLVRKGFTIINFIAFCGNLFSVHFAALC